MEWISVKDKLPEKEGYYRVKFENGDEDEKPFRIRPSKNIYGFMTMEKITHWKPLFRTTQINKTMTKDKTGIELIAEERKRQVEVEGWTAEHDAEHKTFEMSAAAACYVAENISKKLEDIHHTNQSPLAEFKIYDFGEIDFFINSGDRGDRRARKAGWKNGWPWDRKWYKPSQDPVKNLVKAGALIAAEIDRLLKSDEAGNINT